MELLALIGFGVVVVIGVVGYNLYKRPEWAKRKLASLTEKLK
jgi:hypothetical protein